MKEGRKPEYPEKTPGDELQMYIPLVHVNVILNLQKRCTSLGFM